MEAILEQAKQLENAIQQLEKRKADLQSEVSQLDQECEKKRSELAEHMQRYAELDRFVPAGDEVISLDVAGQSFKAYRSTLQQVEDSMLATLASGRWEGRSGSRQEDGRVFLDCNPDAFQEILDFLRRKRVDRSATAAFRPPAARLADYLGIPVSRVIDDIYVAVESQRAGDTKVAPGFMFDVSISGPWHCILQAITFSMGRGGTVSLHVRSGSCLGEAQTASQGWEKICSSQVAMGRNRLMLPRGGATLIGPGAVLAIYLSFTEGADDLLYSDKPSQTTHKVLSEHRTLSEGMKLLCWRGRVTGVAPFSSGAHMDDRFFVGNIEYSLE